MEPDVTPAVSEPAGDPHRRRAAHLYGLIVSGAVLATAGDELRLVRVAIILFSTLLIYWAAETYVHWMAARTHLQRGLQRRELRAIVRDGWPLVAACAVPMLCLGLEAILGIETALALDLTLAVNAVLLFVVGWQMAGSGGLAGMRQAVAAATAGLLGLALIALKALMH
jgi:hypothetical protein